MLCLLGNYSYGQHSLKFAPNENFLKGKHDVLEEKDLDNGTLLITRKLIWNEKTEKKDSTVHFLIYEDSTQQREVLLKGFNYYKPRLLYNIDYNEEEQLIAWLFDIYEEGYYIKIFYKKDGDWKYLKNFYLKYGYDFMSSEVDFEIINKDAIKYMGLFFIEKGDSLYGYNDLTYLFDTHDYIGEKWKKFKRKNKKLISSFSKMSQNLYHFKYKEQWFENETSKIKIGDQFKTNDNKVLIVNSDDFRKNLINDFIIEIKDNKIVAFYRKGGPYIRKVENFFQTPENL